MNCNTQCGITSVVTAWLFISSHLFAGQDPMPFTINVTNIAPLVHSAGFEFLNPRPIDTKFGRALLDAVENPLTADSDHVTAEYNKLGIGNRHRMLFATLMWLNKRIVEQAKEKTPIAGDYDNAYFHWFTANNNEALKDCIRRLFEIDVPADSDSAYTDRRFSQFHDLLISYSPLRMTARFGAQFVALAGVKRDMVVADIGGGPGHLAFALSSAVGTQGCVYAVDVRQLFADTIRSGANHVGARNIIPVISKANDIAITNSIDMAILDFYCPGMYCGLTEQEKDEFIFSIRKALKPGGQLVVVDNRRPVDAMPPPYYSYIDESLMIAQLSHYGFRLQECRYGVDDVYVLVFRNVPDFQPASDAGKIAVRQPAANSIAVGSKHSLLRFSALVKKTPVRSLLHQVAARSLLEAMDRFDAKTATHAESLFNDIIATDNIGGDYAALHWFAKILAYPPPARTNLLHNRYEAYYYDYFAANNFARLRVFLDYFYLARFNEMNSKEIFAAIGDLEVLLFNNPERETWENSSAIIAALHLKPGNRVADVGCGPGYYTFKFGEFVGTNGVVYAVELNKAHLQYIDDVCRLHGITNIRTILSKDDDISVTDKLDVAFLCSLYHAVYVCGNRSSIAGFVESISRALKNDGRLVICDNSVIDDGQRPYHGPCIAKEMVVAQLYQFGYELVETHFFTPQRYMLIFMKSPSRQSIRVRE